MELVVTRAEYSRLSKIARREGVTVEKLVERAIAKRPPRKRNDYAGGGLTRAQAAKQRKELLRDIELEHRRKDTAKLRELREKIAAIKGSGKGRRAQAVEACRAGRQMAKDQAKRLRAEGAAAIRAAAEQEKLAARAACDDRKAKVRKDLKSEAARARAELVEERRYQAEIRRLSKKKKERPRGSSSAERRSESDDEVRANIPADLLALFERVKRTIKATDRSSRTEAFLKYAEENPDEVIEAMQDQSDKELRRLQREAALEERRLRKAGYRSRELAEAVPF